ncbi:DUF1722 domain-containing protein [Paraferrimonas sp. SM1919]|uniref:YbgA family protein n=1 Tax=Paraferrimonas sp. SM1919 TaxID=2662263 RepID=UPI00196A06FE|nr:DUF1722 domain-containing protein [Paraferrimonas sp. SM1919]
MLQDSTLKIGISACVAGEKVRFDRGMKPSGFVLKQLIEHCELVKFCPEMSIGLGVPRETLRLVGNINGVEVVQPKTGNKYHEQLAQLVPDNHDTFSKLSGYIVCKASPSCGMERVKVYLENGMRSDVQGVGAFTAALMQRFPWLPVEEDGRLNDPILRENFVTRIFTLHRFQQQVLNGAAKDLVNFHTQHKFLILSHSPELYYQMGKLVAQQGEHPWHEVVVNYRSMLMRAMAKPASKKRHVNVLEHMQGFFKDSLGASDKQELSRLIQSYRIGEQPLMAPMTLIKHYAKETANPFLLQQYYFQPYPKELPLRYGL